MIRAGYLIDNQGYQSGTPDTYMSGWGYEYLQDISYHTEGWKYEYVLGTFSELIAKHEAGEIDLMSSVSYTPERAENLLYSTNPSGKKCYYVYVKPDRGELTVGDDIMLVLIGGDIRPHVVDALQSLVGTIKNECVSEVEREA